LQPHLARRRADARDFDAEIDPAFIAAARRVLKQEWDRVKTERFPLIGCEVVVRFHADVSSNMLREILLQIPHENGATVMSQDFGVA